MRPDERELDEELRGHLALSIKERIDRGEDPKAARRAALAELGYLPAVRDSMQRVWYSRWFDAVAALALDMRVGMRSLWRARGLSAAVVVTAVLLIATVEREINAIFRVREPRSLARRALVYGLSVPFAVLAIGAAVHTTRWLIERSLQAAPYAEGALALVELPVAIGLATLVFSALYLILPARRVPLRAALAGGLVAALAFEAGKRGFMLYATHAPGYRRVYGALAVVPLFLVWIYVSWVIVLLGAAVAATLAEGPARPSRRGT